MHSSTLYWSKTKYPKDIRSIIPNYALQMPKKGNLSLILVYYTLQMYLNLSPKGEADFDIFFRHLKPQGVADFTV
jgi:hypothetical protein